MENLHHFARLELAKLIEGSAPPPDQTLTPQSSLVRFFKERHLPLIADIHHREITRYVTSLRRFWQMLGREPLLSDLTLDNLLRFRTWLIEQHGLKPGTAHHYPKTLRAIWTTAHRQGLAAEPCRFPELTTPPPAELQPWKASDVEAMLREAATGPAHSFVGPVPFALWWAAYLAVMLDTGLGHREILDLLWDDADTLELSPATRGLLARLRERSPDLPFVWPFDLTLRDKQTLFATFKRLLIRAGLSATRYDAFERLRQTGRDLSPEERQRIIAAGVGHLADQILPPAPPVVDVSLAVAPSLLEVFEGAYCPMRLIDSSPAAKKNYRLAIEALSRFIGRKATTDDLTDINVSRLMEACVAKGNTPTTANKQRAMLVSLWNFCAKKRLTKTFPDVPKLKGYYRAPTAWTVAEIGRIIDAARVEPGYVSAVIDAGIWWPAIILTVYDTGLRLGAVMKASGDAFDPATGKLTIKAEWQKQRADQVFTLHADTAALLARFPSPRRKLFPWSDHTATFYNRYHGILRRAGLPCGRRDQFHKIRRTTATLAVSLGMDATRQLGHSGPAVTEVYIDRSQLPDTDLANRMPRPSMKGGAA